MSGKTEQPTPKRRREARAQGNFPRSRMLSLALSAAGVLLGLAFAATRGWLHLRQWTVSVLSGGATGNVQDAVDQGLHLAGLLVGPAWVGGLVGGGLGALLQAGFHFHPEQIRFNPGRLGLGEGLKRIFGAARWTETGRSVLWAVLAVLGVSGLVWSVVPSLLRLGRFGGAEALDGALTLVQGLGIRAVALLGGLGGLDYLWARRRHGAELRMSREELKREHRENEGDPHHKAQRKAIHRQLALQGPARGVQKASVIVVNPTHIAVALRYSEGECEAPYLVAKGREEDAFEIRREAARLRIPIVRDIPLARSLIHYDVGEQIPPELYGAAAAVLRVAMNVPHRDAPSRSQTS